MSIHLLYPARLLPGRGSRALGSFPLSVTHFATQRCDHSSLCSKTPSSSSSRSLGSYGGPTLATRLSSADDPLKTTSSGLDAGRRTQTARGLSSTISERLEPDFPLVSFSRTSGFALGGDSPFAAVFPDVITPAEEEELLMELEPVFKRKRYEKGHWDSVIEDYKESERLDGSWSPQCQRVLDSIRSSIGLPEGGEMQVRCRRRERGQGGSQGRYDSAQPWDGAFALVGSTIKEVEMVHLVRIEIPRASVTQTLGRT